MERLHCNKETQARTVLRTVNRHNEVVIHRYLRMGFKTVEERVTGIGI